MRVSHANNEERPTQKEQHAQRRRGEPWREWRLEGKERGQEMESGASWGQIVLGPGKPW